MSQVEEPQTTRAPRVGWRAGAAVYVILLTYVLLAPDPLAWLRPKPTGPKKPPHPYLAWLFNDKVQHFGSYAILAGLLHRATPWNPVAVLGTTAVHGGAIELLQDWFPPRETDLFDWFADVGGAISALVLYRLLSRRRSD